MPKKVRIPTPLRKLTNNEERVAVNAATIGEASCSASCAFAAWQVGLGRVKLPA
jgi:hypothetical protein